MSSFDGKVVVITGAGGGLGRAYALAFAKEGAKVVVNDLGGARDGSGDGAASMADQVVNEIKSAGGEAIASYDSVATMAGGASIIETAVDAFGGVDVLVNNAGILRDKTMLKLTEDQWDIVVQVHLKGTFAVTQPALAQMAAQGRGGRIINTSSYAGLKGNFGQSNYGAAKAGIAGFTRVLALEAARHQVTVNCIAPMAKTRLTDDIDAIPDEMTPDQIAPIVIYLASDAASDVSGRIFGVHGFHLFEYKMELTPGVEKDEPWTVAEIGERLDEITASKGGSSPEAGDDAPAGDDAHDTVLTLLQTNAECFDPERGAGWRALIHFDIDGAGQFGMTVDEGRCSVEEGFSGKPTCVVKVGAETFIGMATGTVDGQKAFMQGKVTATNISDMMKYGTAFDSKKMAALVKERLSGGAAAAAPVEAAPKPEGLNRDFIGRVYTATPDFADPDSIMAYARATNDDNPAYLDLSRPGGIVAPPMYAVRLNVEALLQGIADPDLNADLLRLLHGEQDMTFHDVIRPMDLITVTCEVGEIVDKASGQTLALTVRCARDGKTVVETITTVFIRAKKAKSKPAAKNGPSAKPKPEAPPTLLFEETLTVDADQSHRYAIVSRDENPIHVDEAVAKSAGLPGIILHGLCTMAFCQRAVINHAAGGDPARLKRLKLRFTKPVFPGEELRIQAHAVSESEGRRVLGFRAVNAKDEPVVAAGIAEIV